MCRNTKNSESHDNLCWRDNRMCPIINVINKNKINIVKLRQRNILEDCRFNQNRYNAPFCVHAHDSACAWQRMRTEMVHYGHSYSYLMCQDLKIVLVSLFITEKVGIWQKDILTNFWLITVWLVYYSLRIWIDYYLENISSGLLLCDSSPEMLD